MRTRYDNQLEQLDRDVIAMGNMVVTNIEDSLDSLATDNTQAATRVIEADNLVDRRRHEIQDQCFNLIATQQPAASDLRSITGILTIASELERIGDYAEGIAKITLRIAGETGRVGMDRLHTMSTRTQKAVRDALQSFEYHDIELARRIWMSDDVIDAMYEAVFRDILATMAGDPSAVRSGTYLLWVAHNLERMADRATNIVEAVAFIVTADVDVFRSDALSRSLPR